MVQYSVWQFFSAWLKFAVSLENTWENRACSFEPISCWQWPLGTSAVGLPIKPFYGNCVVETSQWLALLGRWGEGFSAGFIGSVFNIWYHWSWGLAETTERHLRYWGNSLELVPFISLGACPVCIFLWACISGTSAFVRCTAGLGSGSCAVQFVYATISIGDQVSWYSAPFLCWWHWIALVLPPCLTQCSVW